MRMTKCDDRMLPDTIRSAEVKYLSKKKRKRKKEKKKNGRKKGGLCTVNWQE
jgi:hypothetical protein